MNPNNLSRRDFINNTIPYFLLPIFISCRQEKRTKYPVPSNFDSIVSEKTKYVEGEISYAGRSKIDKDIGEIWVDDGKLVYHIAVEDGQKIKIGVLSEKGVVGRMVKFPINRIYWDQNEGLMKEDDYFIGSYGTINADLIEINDYSELENIAKK